MSNEIGNTETLQQCEKVHFKLPQDKIKKFNSTRQNLRDS